jgi:hypothetical protein
MPTPADWKFLRDVMVTLDKQVKNGAVVVGQASIWDLPANIAEAAAAEAYLASVFTRLQEVEKAVDDAYTSPLEKAHQIGREVGMKAAAAAKRASKIAHDIGSDFADRFDKLVDSLMKGGENIATGFGVGAGFLAVVALLLVARALGK